MSHNIESSHENKTVSLVLGSGGARGLAHIGVIHWLEEHGYEIKSIAGSSMGAVIGGIYAAGKLDVYEEWIRTLNKVDIVRLLDVSWRGKGLVKGDKLFNKLIDLVGNEHIENLPISYTAVASDIKNEKEVWMNSGKLFNAIRASVSIPLFFTPYNYRGVILIDGGVLNPIPIAPTFSDETDLTIAVNLGGDVERLEEEEEENRPVKQYLTSFASKFSGFTEWFKKKLKTTEKLDWSAYDIANQAFDAMQSTIARQKLATYPPDYVVEIPKNVCGTLEFDRAKEVIELGYKKAEETFAVKKK
ncbi:patatin-like phospholipase family protein [Kangiella sediminilitoris]|uniref:Serine protease n=1 Tax=Kangiella sediminilitoris TaxID=1144748 RepID=A0A1B3BAH5_9GAMM|nr:patatin-like phospholipase family protein [Kangiella sediminilitoris]AOE49799.1 serine protease [Kangiella sediminilitoris]